MMLTFLGAAGEVTGSCLRVDHERGAFLVDCGLFQGGREADRKNRDALDFELRCQPCLTGDGADGIGVGRLAEDARALAHVE